MIRSNGRHIEWHVVRASPRTPAAGKAAKKRKTPTEKQRLRSKLYNLSLDIRTLQQQIHDLSQVRGLLYARQLATKYDADGSIVRATREFHDRTGLGEALDTPQIRDLFASMIAHDVVFGPFSGRDQLRTTWREFASRFHTNAITLHALRIVSIDEMAETCVVRIDSTTHGTATRAMLAIFFPAVLKDPRLAVVVGKPLSIPSVVHMTFDRNQRIVNYDADLDLVAALVKLTGDAVRTAELLDQAEREHEGQPYAQTHAHEMEDPSVETIWSLDRVDREPEVEAEPRARRENRHDVTFLLS